ncbi:MAG: hypothetical protein ACLPXB_05815 [Thiobacillaceae bacterium]
MNRLALFTLEGGRDSQCTHPKVAERNRIGAKQYGSFQIIAAAEREDETQIFPPWSPGD